MKKLLSLLSVLTISGTAMPNVIAASKYEKEQHKIEKREDISPPVQFYFNDKNKDEIFEYTYNKNSVEGVKYDYNISSIIIGELLEAKSTDSPKNIYRTRNSITINLGNINPLNYNRIEFLGNNIMTAASWGDTRYFGTKISDYFKDYVLNENITEILLGKKTDNYLPKFLTLQHEHQKNWWDLRYIDIFQDVDLVFSKKK